MFLKFFQSCRQIISPRSEMVSRGVLGRIRALVAEVPQISLFTRARLKARILRHVAAEATLTRKADLLDRQLRCRVPKSSDLMRTLILLAREVTRLPKVLPHVVFREALRNQIVSRQFSFITFFRYALAPAMLLVLIGVIALTSFVSQTQVTFAEAARLDIHFGTVKIREANTIFFLPTTSNTIVKVGDTIRVEKNSEAALQMLDKSQIKLATGSEVSIKSAHLNTQSAEKSSVRVALITGSVEAKVAKTADAPTLQIETSTGLVESNKAEFAVTVNETTGAMEVTTQSDTVAVRSSDDDATTTSVQEGEVALLTSTTTVQEGEVALLTSTTTEIVVTKSADDSAEVASEVNVAPPIVSLAPPPDPATLKQIKFNSALTKIDILRIRMFDALSSAEADKLTDARLISEKVSAELNTIFVDLGGVPSEGDVLTTLPALLASDFAEMSQFSTAQVYITSIQKIKNLLGYYFDSPSFRREVPEFAIAERERYSPPAELTRLYIALSTRRLATMTVSPLVEEFISDVALEYSKDLKGPNAKARVERLLRGMGKQPIYISALEKMRSVTPTSVRYLLDNKILELQGVLTKYAGN